MELPSKGCSVKMVEEVVGISRVGRPAFVIFVDMVLSAKEGWVCLARSATKSMGKNYVGFYIHGLP